MFSYPVRSKTFRVFSAFLCLITLLFCGCTRQSSFAEQDVPAACRAFLVECGWHPAEEPVQTGEVVIPYRFNAVYERYNQLQRAQGFDLAEYRGKTVIKVVYMIRYHPAASENDPVYASVFWCGGKIIGGDISCARLDGFMHGFHKEGFENGNAPSG